MLSSDLGFEVIPFPSAERSVLAHVPRDVPLTVTVSATTGQDATLDLADRLAGHGYRVAPHLSAQLVRDRAHLRGLVRRCGDAGITGVFVVGGDRRGGDPVFGNASSLLRAVHELDHGFLDVGIAGHPEGHPDVPVDELFAALAEKAPLATYVTTQMVFDPRPVLGWARELLRRGIDLPVRVGVPGAVSRSKLLRVSAGLGLGESAKFLTRHQNLFWRFLAPGGYRPDRIVGRLTPHLGGPDHRITGFHVFTFNDLGPTEEWRRRTRIR